LVRGLDYYNGVVFEITAEGLGAQNAVAGGGRYNNLYQEIGGNVTPCTGFSIGMERLLTAIEAQDPKAFEVLKLKKVYFAPLEDHVEILRLCREKAILLREAGARPETAHGVFSLSQHLKKANQLGLRFMVIMGPDELGKKIAVVKDLEKREQFEVSIEQLVTHLKKVMNLC
ncbi:MAG: ATP phosphoribosyltransferase regulatory subunit, partial [Candidatus Omnitrophica bacterium]|nr:ATP phosphoribosyltransferase regulatory subunit [Candidatus Omnitrophota bacterium]